MQPQLIFENVRYLWPSGEGILNASFSVNTGEFLLITGPSGSGKSTLLRLMVRLEEVQQGVILFDGRPLQSYAPPQLRSRIGYVQQTPCVPAGTVRHALLLPYSFVARQGNAVPDDADLLCWMERMGLGTISLTSDVLALSVGQQQRVCLIRSLLLQPSIICLDEPTSALDKESRFVVEQVVEEMVMRGMTVCMVHHSRYHPSCPHMHIQVVNGSVETLT